MATPRLCLNMIVKNESRVIRRLLESVASVVDCYCICDTGSTDNTIDIIRDFFAERQIPGEIGNEPFRDFGHNRSFALKMCETMASPADYVLLLDADMIFQLNKDLSPEEFKRGLTKDVYYIYQGSESFYHKNVRIVKNHIGASYWGVTHEYLKSPPGAVYDQIPKQRAFINDIGDGGSKSDKFVRDIRLLKKGLEEIPNNDRYTFYLANSYRDNGDTELAIETYKKRTELGGWHEEIWYSYYNIGKCYRSLGDMVQAIHWWLEGYQFFPKRIENLYEIIHYYRLNGKSELAYLYYNMAMKQVALNPTGDYLFMARDIYDYKLDYEFSVFGYYCNVDKYDLTRICMKVLNCKLTEDNIARNVLSNYKFYATKLLTKIRDADAHLAVNRLLENIGREEIAALYGETEFVSSTPSLAMIQDVNGDEVLAVNVRYVNYRINEKGGYENKEHITTVNRLAEIRLKDGLLMCKGEMAYDREHDGLYQGLEDVRLFSRPSKMGEHFEAHQPQLWYNANRGLGPHKLVIEHGEVDYAQQDNFDNSGCLINSILINEPSFGRYGFVFKADGQHEVEKNWVLFEDAAGNVKIIYKWHPLVIGDLKAEAELPDSDDEVAEPAVPEKADYLMVTTHTIDTPPVFKHFRGSTNGVRVGDEIWFICHTVSYEDRRYYYHAFVALDARTYNVVRYTPLFTFEGEKVEYTLGFVVYNKDSLLIGYSVMDRSTKYVVVPIQAIEEMMI